MNQIFQGKDINLSLKSSSELLFGQFWEISVDGMRVTDEQGKIIAVNDAFCRIVDMGKDELEGQLFPVIYHQSEQQTAQKIYKDVRISYKK